jgi:hypothetical protein
MRWFLLLLLLLPPGCAPEEDNRLKAGAARMVITPTVEPFEDLNDNRSWDEGEPYTDLNGDGKWTPVWLGGFGSNRPALGVHDDLWARVLVLEKGGTRIGIASLDWVGLMHDHCLQFADAAEEAGLELDQLIVSSTHDHEAPDTMGMWGPEEKSGRDDEYVAWAREQTVLALEEAVLNLAPVRIHGGVGRTENLTNDSRDPQVKHEQVTALRFDRADGSGPLAVVVHWSNHPEVLGGRNQFITADFPDSLVSTLEEAVPGAVGIFWQGTVGGLLNPMGVDVHDQQGERLDNYTFEKSFRLGEIVAETALEALENGEDITADGRLAFRRRFFLVPMDNVVYAIGMVSGIVVHSPYDQHGRKHDYSEAMSIDLHIRTQVTVVDLGEVQIATVPGELYPELALEGPNGETYYEDPQDPGADFYGTPCAEPIYRFMRKTPYRIVLGLANDEVGYIVPKCQWDVEEPYTYGRDEAPYGEVVSPGPEMAPILNQVLAEELTALNES